MLNLLISKCHSCEKSNAFDNKCYYVLNVIDTLKQILFLKSVGSGVNEESSGSLFYNIHINNFTMQ